MLKVMLDSMLLLGDNFLVQVGLHLASVLCLLLFITVLEALSKEIRSEYPEELVYLDSLTLVS